MVTHLDFPFAEYEPNHPLIRKFVERNPEILGPFMEDPTTIPDDFYHHVTPLEFIHAENEPALYARVTHFAEDVNSVTFFYHGIDTYFDLVYMRLN